MRQSANSPYDQPIRHGGSTPRLLLTPREAGEALGVGQTKLYRLLGTGQLGSVKIDGCRRIPVDDLSEFVASLRSGVAESE